MLELTKIGDYQVSQPSRVAGVVRYKATHVVLPRRALIEVVSATATRATAVGVLRHACIVEALHHPGIPRVFECGILDGRPWVAFEWSDGITLETELATRQLELDDLLDVIERIAAILTHAHARGVLHRDITPGAIVRVPGGGVVLQGWGNACTSDTKLPCPVVGSDRYRAPELARGRVADARADVFALGVIAWQALRGRDAPLPTRGADVPVQPAELAELIAEMVAETPLLRPTAAEVVKTIRALRARGDACVIEGGGADYASLEVSLDQPAEQPAEQADDNIVRLEQPRSKSRWTPQWGVGAQAVVARCTVEIQPRSKRTGSDDGER